MNAVTQDKPLRRRRVMGIILAIVIAAIVIVLVVASTKSDTFRIARSATVNAPPEAIYPMIADFHRWTEWSPYETLDADLKRSYGGAENGVGATYAWEGKKAGAGRMEIVDVTPPNPSWTSPSPSRPAIWPSSPCGPRPEAPP